MNGFELFGKRAIYVKCVNLKCKPKSFVAFRTAVSKLETVAVGESEWHFLFCWGNFKRSQLQPPGIFVASCFWHLQSSMSHAQHSAQMRLATKIPAGCGQGLLELFWQIGNYRSFWGMSKRALDLARGLESGDF